MAQYRWNWLHWPYRVFVYVFVALLLSRFWPFATAVKTAFQLCGDIYYHPFKYTCFSNELLCPVVHGVRSQKCGDLCYLPSKYSCQNNEIIPLDFGRARDCSDSVTSLHLSDPPYEDYMYFDCHSASQVVITSPLPSSNLELISPRLLVAWPSGNSGLLTQFEPENGVNGSLSITLSRFLSTGERLRPIYDVPLSNSLTGNPRVGVSGILAFNSSAILTVPILGSIRTMRDYAEGSRILRPEIQDAIKIDLQPGGRASLSRLWLDNRTTTELSFTPLDEDHGSISMKNNKLVLEAGLYQFHARFDFMQLNPLKATALLNPSSSYLVSEKSEQIKSLEFLSYSDKLLAGAWRFLTYFGRDSLISLLLLQPILSEGEGGAIEAVISAVLERLNGTDGTVCHEETIGDYATWMHLRNNVTSTAPICEYHMVDTDYFLPIAMQDYLIKTKTGQKRAPAFFAHRATLPFGNEGVTYADLALLNAEKIMAAAAPFAAPGGQSPKNMISLLPGHTVGEWRDSNLGLGGGRVPFDINAALVPAALRAISALSSAGHFPAHPEWPVLAASYAQVWEDRSLEFFSISIPTSTAKSMVESFVSASSFTGPSNTDDITAPIDFYAISIKSQEDSTKMAAMHTDTAFRLFLLNTTNDEQLTAFLNATADSVLLPFPAGLLTDIGLLVANPAYSTNPAYVDGFSRDKYHGTVVWGWPMAMMAAGFERQLARCTNPEPHMSIPAFCGIPSVHGRVLSAYNHLWDVLDKIKPQLSQEVWSWNYGPKGYEAVPLGAFSNVESDVVQLWSLAYLAVVRNQNLR